MNFQLLEGLKAWDVTGITDNDMHDRKAHQVFLDVIEELEQKLGKFEEAGKLTYLLIICFHQNPRDGGRVQT